MYERHEIPCGALTNPVDSDSSVREGPQQPARLVVERGPGVQTELNHSSDRSGGWRPGPKWNPERHRGELHGRKEIHQCCFIGRRNVQPTQCIGQGGKRARVSIPNGTRHRKRHLARALTSASAVERFDRLKESRSPQITGYRTAMTAKPSQHTSGILVPRTHFTRMLRRKAAPVRTSTSTRASRYFDGRPRF